MRPLHATPVLLAILVSGCPKPTPDPGRSSVPTCTDTSQCCDDVGLNRIAGVPSMANVAQSYEINFRSSNPVYRPLNDRKQIVQLGYTAWAQFGP